MAHVKLDLQLNKASKEIENAAKLGANEGMQKVLRRSQEIVPLDETPLQKSGKVTEENLTFAVSYDTDYAVIQHENLQYRHAPGRQAKYLEQPFRELQQTIIDDVGKRVKEIAS